MYIFHSQYTESVIIRDFTIIYHTYKFSSPHLTWLHCYSHTTSHHPYIDHQTLSHLGSNYEVYPCAEELYGERILSWKMIMELS